MPPRDLNTDPTAHGPAPTVGRIVHVYGGVNQREPLAGIITGVGENGRVDLTVFKPAERTVRGAAPVADDVVWAEATFDARGAEAPYGSGLTWTWPPRGG